MRSPLVLLATASIALAATITPALAGPKKLPVVTTLNVLAALARDVGGERVTVSALAKPNQDPHTLVAKPTYKVAAKNAKLFVELGLGLDGWGSAVTDASGNPGIQVGQPGRVIASDGIPTKELPATLSKAWGDIHPQGNPHVWLDPVNAKQLAANIAAGLIRIDPDGKDVYAANLAAFQARLDDALYGHALVEEYGASKLERLSRRGELVDYLKGKGTYDQLGGWLKRAEPLRGLKVITYHKTWIYFCDRFGITIAGEIEEKPGIPPSQSYLATLIARIKADGVRVLFVDTIYPAKDGAFIAGKTGAKVVSSPIDVGGVAGTGDYFALIDTLLDRVLAAAKWPGPVGYLHDLYDINGLPLLACLAVSGILVYLGMHVVERKVIFVDLALAQIAALGVMWAILMGYDHETETFAVTLYSLAFTAVGAVVFSITRTKNERVPHEALIGIIYVTATAGGLVLADRFALGTEALKELIAGRVALVTPAILTKLVVTCAVVGAAFAGLHRRLLRISTDPKAAEAAGVSIRLWDFVFYLLFGVLITQSVAVLGVLPVFAYLVIPAVAAAFLFESVRARLIFGWLFAGVVSLVGLELARLSQLDPGPTIVCLFAAALVLLGVFLFLRAQRFAGKAVVRVLGFAVLFAGFLGGTLVFRKAQRTDELATAIEFARSGDPTRMRQAMASFRRFPEARARWVPLVVPMLGQADPVARDAAAALLVETHATEAAPALAARLAAGVEADDTAREGAVRALRALGDASAVPALIDAAEREEEPDLAIAMVEAGLALAKAGREAEVQRGLAVLTRIASDQGAPRAARRDASELLQARGGMTPPAPTPTPTPAGTLTTTPATPPAP